MSQPTPEQHKALNQLRESPHVVDFIEGWLEETQARMTQQPDETALRWSQGTAQALLHLRKLIHTEAQGFSTRRRA